MHGPDRAKEHQIHDEQWAQASRDPELFPHTGWQKADAATETPDELIGVVKDSKRRTPEQGDPSPVPQHPFEQRRPHTPELGKAGKHSLGKCCTGGWHGAGTHPFVG